MALKARLTVTGEQGQGLGSLGSHEFGATGGIIGRSTTCDWRLPDPTNTLSARHAEIRFTGQGFTVVDLSTNGVYVNVTDAPLGRGNSALLVTGDLVYLGPYVISVDVRRVADPPPPQVLPQAAPQLAPQPMSRPAPFAAAPAPLRTGGFARPRSIDPGQRTPLDPLAALDGEDTLQEGENPFKDLGIGKRDRDRSDFGLRSSKGAQPGAMPQAPGAIPDFNFAPQAPAVPPAFTAPPAARPDPIPVSPPVMVPPPVMAPQPLPAAPLPVEPAVIPSDFLDELSALIPRLAETPLPPQAAPAPLRPVAPPPAPAFMPLPEAPGPDDPEAMVTMLRMRSRGKPAGTGLAAPPVPPMAPPVPAAPPAFAQPAPIPPVAALPTYAPPPFPSLAPQGTFWDLFGIDPTHLSAEERDRVLTDAAGLIRGLVSGLLELQATRRRMKSELSLDATQVVGDDNPFRVAASTEDAMRRLFAAEGLGRRDPGGQARAVFREMQIHELAAMDAMQATISRLMQRISPAAITFEMEGEGQNGGVFARRIDKAKLWDRYLVMHERLVDALDVLSPELVGQEFARAYAHHVQTMRGGQG
ncbi:type VI secretion system-associated FHA domain protein TagH [Aquabacter cavernae]|uniref:type VI secretion system-associated FHA domain protein TagH n=1 Tax=Aquabacter cavernae TaxID=2496029 RepID=UPI00196B223E|nr:type VI secretion system-associated FHA domain protein TagH [Aquabacter cavernae]